jgi:hypothetical protein
LSESNLKISLSPSMVRSEALMREVSRGGTLVLRGLAGTKAVMVLKRYLLLAIVTK